MKELSIVLNSQGQISARVASDPKYLVANKIGLLIHDESHVMRTAGTLWQMVNVLAQRAGHTVLMTATPIITGCRVSETL